MTTTITVSRKNKKNYCCNDKNTNYNNNNCHYYYYYYDYERYLFLIVIFVISTTSEHSVHFRDVVEVFVDERVPVGWGSGMRR